MSNYAYADVLGDGGRAVIVGPETVNGTGQVCLNADAFGLLTNEEAIKLGRALIEAAEYAKAVQDEKENWPGRSATKSVLDVAWTDPGWRPLARKATPTQGAATASPGSWPGSRAATSSCNTSPKGTRLDRP